MRSPGDARGAAPATRSMRIATRRRCGSMRAVTSTPSRSRPAARLALIIAGIVAAVVAIAWIALTILFPPDRVRGIVQAQVSRMLAREVRFSGAGLSLFPPVRLGVTGFAL